jgi:hypothetical protein
MCDFSLLGSGNAEPGCHILSAEHEWREGPPMTQARTQHTLTVVGDKIGELPLLKGQRHQSFHLKDFCHEPVSPRSQKPRDNIPLTARKRTLFLAQMKTTIMQILAQVSFA